MNDEGGEENSPQNLVALELGCSVCSACENNLCSVPANRVLSAVSGVSTVVSQTSHAVKARRLILHNGDTQNSVPVICSGWAASMKLLPDGRRQILSFLLPGDIASAGLLFTPKPGLVVEAITDVHYRAFKYQEMKAMLLSKPGVLDKLLNDCIAAQSRADRLIVDLGRRSGEERIARLILNLAQRLKVRGMMRGPDQMDFPLRQHHIADATGLTQVHVSKVISDFRRSRLVEFHQRSVTIIDLEGLRRRADVRSCARAREIFYARSAA